MKTTRFQAVGFCLFLAGALVGQASATSFQGLGSLMPGGSSAANGVSADGSTVVGVSDYMEGPTNDDTGTQAFRWTSATGMVGLGDPTGLGSSANAVSANGTVVVGGSGADMNPFAFRWTGSGLDAIGGLAGAHSRANGVSADGSTVVGESVTASGPYHAFRATGGGANDLGALSDGGSFANGVSADGSVAAGWTYGPGSMDAQACVWRKDGQLVGLGDLAGGTILGGFNSTATAVSADGSVVVGESIVSASTFHAFRWTDPGAGVDPSTGMVDLGALGDGSSKAYAVSADGKVIVGDSGEAFIWTPDGGMQSLRDLLDVKYGLGQELAGWTLFAATGISADGLVIVGTGIDPDQQAEAWIADLRPTGEADGAVPEPLTILGALAGMASLGGYVRRRRLA